MHKVQTYAEKKQAEERKWAEMRSLVEQGKTIKVKRDHKGTLIFTYEVLVR